MPLAEEPKWQHNGSGKHTLVVGIISMECLFDGDCYQITVNGSRLPLRPTDITEAKWRALGAARQMVNRTAQLLEAGEA